MLIKIPGHQMIRASSIIDYAPGLTAQITEITVRADVAGNLNNKHFHIWSANNATAYTVWFNVNSAGTDPRVPYTTAIEVALSTNANTEDVADALGAALEAEADFDTATSSGSIDVVRVTNADDGGSSFPTPGWAHTTNQQNAYDAGFTFLVTQVGLAFTMPTNLPMVKITGKMLSQKAQHHGPFRGEGAGVLLESPFNWTDVVVIVPQESVQYLREV